jgi:hypothetical protein
MPTAGTHITIIERLALDPRFSPVLGDPYADVSEAAGKQMRYAKLGAIGPDIFYALMDYGSDLQDLTNFLAKLSGSFECISEVMKDIDSSISAIESDLTLGAIDTVKQILAQFESVFGLVTGIITEGLMAIVIDRGFNFFPVFEARRQQDRPRTEWFWADYLHYVRTGAFVKELFDRSSDNPNLRAFAYGYLSHYVTDVVGHPFVNQVVGAPWRMYWQRHHLVENFIDVYVWDRWHDPQPAPVPPSTEEQPLDRIRSVPHQSIGQGAPFTFARLNDHVNVGYLQGSDPVDDLIQSICKKIKDGLEQIGVAEPDPIPPNDSDFVLWTNMLSEAFRSVYPPTEQPPENLKNPAAGRPDGYPNPEDVASAYSVFRLFLRMATEEKIQEPEFPDVVADVWNAMKKVLDDLRNNLGSLLPFPAIGVSPGANFSFEALWKAIVDWVKWVADTAVKIGKAAFQFMKDALAVGGTLLVDSVKIGLYFVKKALFDIYKAFRHYLVRTAYAIPFTDELDDDLGGGIRGISLWTTPEERMDFPLEELAELERLKFPSSYPPWVHPSLLNEMRPPNRRLFEDPGTWVAPYPARANPDTFVDLSLGARVMLSSSGPVSFGTGPVPRPADFGGAIANCESAFAAVAAAQTTGSLPLFPDYNLDGDRGYAWPCWDVAKPGFDHLNPAGGRHILVNPVLIK